MDSYIRGNNTLVVLFQQKAFNLALITPNLVITLFQELLQLRSFKSLYSVFLFICFIPTIIISQNLQEMAQKTQLEQNYKMSSNSGTSSDNLADNSIDENSYMIGAGDKFSIFSEEVPTVSYVGSVNQDLKFVVADFGILNLGKISLLDAKKTITEYFLKKSSQKVYVYLTNVKNVSFSVFPIYSSTITRN